MYVLVRDRGENRALACMADRYAGNGEADPVQAFDALILYCLLEAVYRTSEACWAVKRLALEADLDEVERMLQLHDEEY